MRLVVRLVLLACLALVPAAALAQSPNTATVVVLVSDQSGGAVPDAAVTIANAGTGALRASVSGADGAATVAGLPLTGAYSVTVAKPGFATEERQGITLRAGETATLRVKLVVGAERAEVTVYGTTEGVRADPQIGGRLDSRQIDETPTLGRKVSSLPLLNAAFRPAKGTGDLYVNSTFFVTGAGGRRQTTFTLDGANNDDGWGRQAMIATVPIGAVQEMALLSNAFSSEFGWTSGPAINVVTKSGTNAFHGEGLFLGRPGGMQAGTFSTKGFCPPSVPTCVTPPTLKAINPVDIPDELVQVSGAVGGPIVTDRTFFFAAGDYTRQDRTTYLSPALPSFVLPADGNLAYTGEYRQSLFDARVDHKLTGAQSLMLRMNLDRFHDTNPQDTVGGTSAPSVARSFSRRSWTAQANHSAVIRASLFNEARVSYLHGDPVSHWVPETLSTTYARSGSVPFTVGQSRTSDMFNYQLQLSDTLSWSRGRHYVRAGGSLTRHRSGGQGSEFGTAVLGTFTFRNTTTAPLDQLTLADVQQYSQPLSYGITTYALTQWMSSAFVQDSVRVGSDLTLDLGLRYDHQSLTDARSNVAPRAGFGWHPGGDARLAVRGGYGMYYTQIRSNLVGNALVGGLDGLASYTAVPGQLGFPACLTAPCVPVALDPTTLPASQLPARDITIRAGDRAFYRQQFAKYGLNFDLLPNYPDRFENPRSQVISIGAERELAHGWFVASDYVHQHWTALDRTVDLNAPAPFDRTAPGQTRSVAAANATRPILPAPGGVRQVNVLTNLGEADYDGLQTQLNYRGSARMFLSASYTLSKATNTSEPDGNGVNPNDGNIARLGEEERGPSVLDQRHRAVFTFAWQFPWRLTAGTTAQVASARPFSATTGIDNNGDGANNDRPVIDGHVAGKSSFRSTAMSDVAIFAEERITVHNQTLLLRLEGFNLFNHGNFMGRGLTTYGDTGTPNATFGQLASVGSATNAIPAFANIDPPRMFQLQVRYLF